MIRPPWLRPTMAPPMILVQMKALVRFRSISSRQRVTLMSRIGAGSRRPPTLLIRMSNGPCAASARPQAVSQIAASPMSAWIVHAWRPSARISAAVRSRLAGSRPQSATSAPASAIASAISRPRPRLPPVMKSRLPFRRNRSSTLIATPRSGKGELGPMNRQFRGWDRSRRPRRCRWEARGRRPARCRAARVRPASSRRSCRSPGRPRPRRRSAA